VPPKKGGRKCDGKAIREKPCNAQPCPGSIHIHGEGSQADELNETLSPIVKSLPFSARKQNYVKCVIKESDVFYLMAEGPGPNAIKTHVPSRIVLNNRTISLFEDDSYKHAVFTFNLPETDIGLYTKDACCFNLQSGSKQLQVCGGFGSRCTNFVNEWVNDFSLFKTKCYVEMKDFNWKSEMAKQALADAMNAAGMGNMEERANLLGKKLKQKQIDDIQQRIIGTESLAMKAIKKELDIEKLLQQEVQLKAMLETKNLLAQKKLEEKKKIVLRRQ